MTTGGLLVLLLHTIALMAVAAWGAGFCLWPLLRHPRFRNGIEFSSSFWFLLGSAPFLAGIAVGLAPLSSAILKGLAVIPDHCRVHPGHPHFCWTHAEAILPQGIFFWGILVAGTVLFLISLLRVGRSTLALQRELRLAKKTWTEDGFLIVSSRIPAAFVAGLLRPKAYLTESARQLLSSSERRIVAIHEREHTRRRDPLKLLLLRIGASLFPGFSRIEDRWKAAVEIECDWACLDQGAEAEEVSLTILKMARALGPSSSAPTLAYALGSERVLRERVEALLSGARHRRPVVGWGLLALTLSTLAAIGLSSAHHVLETVLGTFIR